MVTLIRPVPNFGDPMGDRGPPNAWHPMSAENMDPSSNAGFRGFGSRLLPKSGDLATPLNQARTISACPLSVTLYCVGVCKLLVHSQTKLSRTKLLKF